MYGCITARAKALLAEAGQVVFIPAGMVHTPITSGYMAALSIYAPEFDPKTLIASFSTRGRRSF